MSRAVVLPSLTSCGRFFTLTSFTSPAFANRLFSCCSNFKSIYCDFNKLYDVSGTCCYCAPYNVTVTTTAEPPTGAVTETTATSSSTRRMSSTTIKPVPTTETPESTTSAGTSISTSSQTATSTNPGSEETTTKQSKEECVYEGNDYNRPAVSVKNVEHFKRNKLLFELNVYCGHLAILCFRAVSASQVVGSFRKGFHAKYGLKIKWGIMEATAAKVYWNLKVTHILSL